MNIKNELLSLSDKKISWKKTTRQGLDVDYVRLLPKKLADMLFKELEETIQYPEISKWLNIPRQQTAFGDPGAEYTFSGTTVPAKPWPECLLVVKKLLYEITNCDFNFVLVNRYRNGNDHIGEHRDAEPDLDPKAPIASLSLGQARDFVLKHGDARKQGNKKKNIPTVKLLLAHGSLLMMNPPTNNIWYHSVPSRKSATQVRLNLTFRRTINKKK